MAGVSRNRGIFVSHSSLKQEVTPHVFASASHLACNQFQHFYTLYLNDNFLFKQKMVREKSPEKYFKTFLKL